MRRFPVSESYCHRADSADQHHRSDAEDQPVEGQSRRRIDRADRAEGCKRRERDGNGDREQRPEHYRADDAE